jgi:hypothetical protein
MASLRQLATENERSQSLRQFSLMGKFVALSKGNPLVASRMAQAGGAPFLVEMLKSPISPATMTDATNAGPLSAYGMVSAFAESLRWVSAFSAIEPFTRRVPLKSRVVVASSGFTAGAASSVEGRAIPVGKLSLSGATTVDAVTASGIAVVTEQLLRLGADGAATLVGELRQAIAASQDNYFLAQLVAGISTTSATGVTASAIRTDLGTAIAAMALSQSSKLYALVAGDFYNAISVLGASTGAAGFVDFPNVGAEGASV